MRCLITSIGSMSAEAVIGRLLVIPDVEVIGCNMHPPSWTPASRLVHKFYQVPSAKDETNYINRLLMICKNEQISHVIVLTDPEVDVLSIHHELFSTENIVLCISPQLSLQTSRDKLAIFRRFYNHPRIYPIATTRLRGEGYIDFSLPLIAKPRYGRSSEGQVRITDAASLKYWCDQLSGKEYILQPFYSGYVIVVDVVRQPDGMLTIAMARQELLRTPNGAGLTVRMLPEHTCVAMAVEIADELRLHGCINIEFLVVDGSPLLMDVNPRFSAGVAFSIMAGYDMAANHLNCFNSGRIMPCAPPLDMIYTRRFVEFSLQG